MEGDRRAAAAHYASEFIGRAATGTARGSTTDRVRVATVNVQTLSTRLEELPRFMEDHGIDVLCIQETRVTFDR
eukprot:2858930-Alexandrium_andersonii.AAC.1